MRLLLDTHAFLWWIWDDPALSERARSAIADGRNEISLSAASAWELAIKAGTDRLEIPEPLDAFVTDHARANGFELLPIYPRHAFAVANLPKHHADPFDRMLIAQASLEGLRLVSADVQVARYDADILW